MATGSGPKGPRTEHQKDQGPRTDIHQALWAFVIPVRCNGVAVCTKSQGGFIHPSIHLPGITSAPQSLIGPRFEIPPELAEFTDFTAIHN